MRFLPLLPALVLPTFAVDLVFENFESDGFGEWKVEGSAFGKAPTAASPNGLNGEVTGFAESYYVSSAHGGDSAVGSLTSPEFQIKNPFLTFLISGGNHRGKTGVQLLIDKQVILEANGLNDLVMRPIVWSLGDYQGMSAQIRITDTETGGWGIINADHFNLSDTDQPFFPKQNKPVLPKAQDLVASETIPGLTVPAGTVTTVFADNERHDIYSPTALTVDEKGHVYLAETHRFRFGVEDNRNHLYWLMDDMAAQTTADRLAMHKKWQEKLPLENLTSHSEKIRVLIDTDGDGVADESKLFADGFNDILDGTAAGIMAFEGKIYFACIPNIWMLQDTDGDLKSDERRVLQDGFGVRVSFSGHDLNGFAIGPDGRIYTTIGDRGFSFTTREGREYKFPNQGAILRFEPDGSNFEVVHHGLRNPKEIAFDQYGTGITVDNNSDQGDEARIVFMLEGADSGWRMGHQVLHSFHTTAGIPNRPINQWMQERMWAPQNDQQPGHIVPPMANLTNGPSGLAYFPGTGYQLNCKDRFLICDYKGSAPASGIWGFSIKNDGAGFTLDQADKFNWGAAVTDVEWGYDGKLYISDFITGWQSHEAGRIYTLSEKNPGKGIAEIIASTNFAEIPAQDLADFLAHDDMRLRLRAQIHLTERPEALPLFTAATNQTMNPLERLHGIWGLGMLARLKEDQVATSMLVQLTRHNDPLVRAQVAQALGESTLKSSEALTPMLTDGSPRVRALAAIAIGRLRDTNALPAVIEMIRSNGNNDPTLRHAGVMALLGTANEAYLSSLSKDESPALRHAALLALRRLNSPELVNFLGDTNLQIADDAIRAIHDTHLEAARPVIAALLDDPSLALPDQRPVTRMILRRLIQSAFRIGNETNLRRLIKAAANQNFPIEERLEGMRLLAQWEAPHVVDQSIGLHAPLPSRDPALLKNVLTSEISALLASGPEIFPLAMQLALKHDIESSELSSASLRRIIRQEDANDETRSGALELFLKGNPEDADAMIAEAARSSSDLLATTALKLASGRDPASNVVALQAALASASPSRRQTAWGIIAALPAEHAVPLLRDGLTKLKNGQGDPESSLDLILAAESRTEPALGTALEEYRSSLPTDDPLAPWRVSLNGGDAKNGFKVYQSHSAAQCMRCHNHRPNQKQDGMAGPSLMGVALRQTAEGLLESLMFPHAQIADGFGLASVKLTDGREVAGTVLANKDDYLDLKTSETDIYRVKKSDIVEKSTPLSSMPSMEHILSLSETRDLVAWLLTLSKENPTKSLAYEAKEFIVTASETEPEKAEPVVSPPQPQEEPMSEENQTADIDPAVMELGKQQYLICSACHGQNGEGVANVGPVLANSEWVNGPAENLIKIQLRGLMGPITVNGKEFNGVMAPIGAGSTNEQTAAVLTYIRNSFGNSAPAVTPEEVEALRGEIGQPMLTVADLIDPLANLAGAADLPPGIIPMIPSDGLGAPLFGILATLLVLGLCGIGVIRMKMAGQS